MAVKRRGRYHHGDLSRALLREAVRIIDREGIDALTLRAVGQRLGVSRTALYRHFADKSALVGAVAAEGFRMLTAELLRAGEGGGAGGLAAMGAAYVHFAVAHPAHYRVMFGPHAGHRVAGSDAEREGAKAFQVLVDALASLQKQKRVRADPPEALAQYVWANVHGIAMLAIDGLLRQPVDAVLRLAGERMRTGIAVQKREAR